MTRISATIEGYITPTRDGGFVPSAKCVITGKSIKGVKRSTLQMALIDCLELRRTLSQQVNAAKTPFKVGPEFLGKEQK